MCVSLYTHTHIQYADGWCIPVEVQIKKGWILGFPLVCSLWTMWHTNWESGEDQSEKNTVHTLSFKNNLNVSSHLSPAGRLCHRPRLRASRCPPCSALCRWWEAAACRLHPQRNWWDPQRAGPTGCTVNIRNLGSNALSQGDLHNVAEKLQTAASHTNARPGKRLSDWTR